MCWIGTEKNWRSSLSSLSLTDGVALGKSLYISGLHSVQLGGIYHQKFPTLNVLGFCEMNILSRELILPKYLEWNIAIHFPSRKLISGDRYRKFVGRFWV